MEPSRSQQKAMQTITVADADSLGYPTFTVAESREVDRLAIDKHGVPGTKLMHQAGVACADRISMIEGFQGRGTVTVLAGAGNNGGDGYIIAKTLHQLGNEVRLISLVPSTKIRGDALWAYRHAVESGVPICFIENARQFADQISNRTMDARCLVIDCLLGTGSQGPPREPMATAIKLVNAGHDIANGITRVAIDVPSGLDADTGVAHEPTFQADLTLTFVTVKTGLRVPDAEPFVGQLEIVDIGLPDSLKRALGLPTS